MRKEVCLIIAMKKFFVFPAVIAVAALISCQKQQTEAEKNAEVEREVQERLAAEHQAEQQQQLQQQQADLDAREKALAEKENAAAATPARRERAEPEPVTRARAVSGAGPTSGYSTFYTKLDYGRWTRLRGIGWVWVPGQQWAPAWVSWRKSNDYVGWAPLPPEARFDQRTGIHNWSDNYYEIGPDQYCFVATREFGAQRAESTILPPERNVAIVNQTTNVTNITYKNTTIVNEGPNYDEVRAQSREPMQRFRLERNASVDVNVEAPRPLVQGETVIVTAPVISAPQASERPRAVKQNITQITVDLGWAAIGDHDAAKKTRDKMKAEATPPSNAPPKKFVKAAATTTTASQGAETPASSASVTATPLPSATISATPAPTAAATSTPETKMTPRRVIPSEPSPTPAATSTPVPSASPLPTPAQRRGRLLDPSATPAPRTMPSATSKSAASASPAVTAIPMPDAASVPLISPGGKLTKQEKKEQKREEKKELKRERKEAAQQGETASPSPSATP